MVNNIQQMNRRIRMGWYGSCQMSLPHYFAHKDTIAHWKEVYLFINFIYTDQKNSIIYIVLLIRVLWPSTQNKF